MLTYKQYIIEATQNKHLTHAEEAPLVFGYDSIHDIVETFEDYYNKIKDETSISGASVKIDGAPAIVFGKDPKTHQFFVASKSIFNKEPKVNYKITDIDKNHADAPGLAKKLKQVYQVFHSYNFDGIYQGDLLFSDHSEKKDVTVDGQEYITFRANTITYAIPKIGKSDLYAQVAQASIGIAIHTKYGGTIEDGLSVESNDIQLSKFSIPKCWIVDHYNFLGNDKLALSNNDKSQYQKSLSILKQIKISPAFLKSLTDMKAKDLIMKYHNVLVRNSTAIESLTLNKYIEGLMEQLIADHQKAIDKLSSDKGKASKAQERDNIHKWISDNESNISMLYNWIKHVTLIKTILIELFSKFNAMSHFLEQPDGTFKITKPEGFVISSKINNNMIKLVDRMDFSKNNFTLEKNWG